MNSIHRKIIKSKRDILTKSVRLEDLEPYLKEYKLFNKYMWNDIKSVSDVFDALPFRGPKAFENMIEILRKAGYDHEACILENPISPKEVRNKNLYYRMTSKPLGYCLIINNVEFNSGKLTDMSDAKIQHEDLEYRHGSDVDAKSLRNFFDGIGYDVLLEERNLEAAEMKNSIEKFSKRDFDDVDSMILIILSHGGQRENRDFICGSDGRPVFKDEIYEYFSNKNCESLHNKPKIFFFIACRGKGKDYGVPERKNFPKESADSMGNYVLPEFSDIYIVHSSLPYQVSLRNHEKGSYFCQALISVLKEYYKVYDLETVIQLVNEKLKNKVSLEYRIISVVHMENRGGSKKILFYQED